MNKYDILGIVGEGAYGIVYKAKNKETGEFGKLGSENRFGEETRQACFTWPKIGLNGKRWVRVFYLEMDIIWIRKQEV